MSFESRNYVMVYFCIFLSFRIDYVNWEENNIYFNIVDVE